MKPFSYLLGTLALLLTLSSCKVGRFVVYNFADIRDYKKFPARTIENTGTDTFYFPVAVNQKAPITLTLDSQTYPFQDFLEGNKTVAFLVIQHDTIQYEYYREGYSEASIVPSFSMAKSVMSILIGCAIADGYIQSVDEPVTRYIPELEPNGFDQVTIEHVLQMTSGLDFNEGYTNPFGEVATYYYGRNLRKAIPKLELSGRPGETFAYKSGNSQLLGLILERALKEKTISAYAQEKLWTPLSMEFPASWSLDRKNNGLEKTFCCLNARARDYAKIGRLYLHNGNWEGKQLVPESWVKTSTAIDTTAGSPWYYQYQWWLPTKTGDFIAQGILGQYIYVNPENDLIIVRLGAKKGDVDWWEVMTSLAQAYGDAPQRNDFAPGTIGR